MIHFRGETLFPPRINAAATTPRKYLPLRSDSPSSSSAQATSSTRKAAAFPIGHRFLRAQTIEIDRHINLQWRQVA